MSWKLDNNQTLLIAPTGWGKTSLILDELEKSTKQFIFYSPLRALADEFYKRCLLSGLKCLGIESRAGLKAGLKNKNIQIYIMTYEQIDSDALGLLIDGDYLHIFDEVHLNDIWGESFRPVLKDFLDIYLHLKLNTLFLTATASEKLIDYMNKMNSELTIINIANYKIKTIPKRFYYIPSTNDLFTHLSYFRPNSNGGCTLVFCKYKKQVKALAEQYRREGLKVLSCVSGEVDHFKLLLGRTKSPDFIFATSTLSHGVNLPSLENVVITYPIENKELWVQMIGRGGRQGEDFSVFQRNFKSYEKTNVLKGVLRWYVFKIRIKLTKIWKWN